MRQIEFLAMLPAEKQQQLVTQYLRIEDPQERMTLLLDRARKSRPISESERIDANRVHGCVSRVWLIGEIEEGRCRFRLDAESALVKGLAAIVCDVYEGSPPSEAANFETTILEELRIANQLSPTRRHGLQQVARTIREFAQIAGQERSPAV